MAVSIQGSSLTGTSTTSGTTVAVTNVVAAPGWTIMAVVAFDNLSVTTPIVSSLTKFASETASWVQIGYVDADTATAAAAVRGELWAITTTVEWTATTVTATLNGTVTAKAMGVRPFFGVSTTLRGTKPTGTATATAISSGGTPSAVTAGTVPAVGDLVLGFGAFENNAVPALDTDTTGGAWIVATNVASSGGGAAANAAVTLQYKITTASGAQTFNPVGSSDSGVGVLALVPKTLSTPSTPTLVSATGTLGTVTLTWNYVTDAESYTIYRDGVSIATGQTGKTYADTTGVNGTSYSWTIAAVNGAGTSSQSNAISAAPTNAPLVSTFSETFSAALDSTKWPTVLTGSVSGGAYVVTTTNNTDNAGIISQILDFTDGIVSIQMTVPASTNSAFDIYQQTNSIAKASILVNTTAATVSFSATGSTFIGSTSVAYSSTSHAYLRFRTSGAVLYFDGSPDGTTWTNLSSTTLGTAWTTGTTGYWGRLHFGSSSSTPGSTSVSYDNIVGSSNAATAAAVIRRPGKRRF